MARKGHKKGQISLTKQNLKFIELVIKGVKDVDAYALCGYKGGIQSVYQLKHKLKPFIEKAHEIEGLSKEGYKSRLLKLLNLPCVDKEGKEISKLSFNQYTQILNMLKEELDKDKDKQSNRPQITAFVIRTHEEATKDNKGGAIQNVTPQTITQPPFNMGN